eukprot:2623465-Pleurochrysis_carterae.AAC.1
MRRAPSWPSALSSDEVNGLVAQIEGYAEQLKALIGALEPLKVESQALLSDLLFYPLQQRRR